LEPAGHRIFTASSGTAALYEACERQPDVVLMDLNLEDMDGRELARRLRSLPDDRRPLLVSVSAEDQPHEARPPEMDLHLPKPVKPDYLLGLLERFRSVSR
jgi:CheY-like chemotaxis protein